VVANKKFWDGLPADIRKVLDDALVKSTTYGNAITKTANEQALEGIRKTGKTTVITLAPGEREEWKKVLRKTHEQMTDRISKPLLQSIYKETGDRR
ncbi:MAG TPA: C4-dicarboxylate ABC transporter, partial [Caldimonas sp.]|nr:C4-dicarboxylate ABC transporter [Caldimonas sp.]